MNRSQDILDYLTAEESPSTVVLAPNAPPVVHAQGEVRVILPMILTAGDVFDTLLALKAMTSKRELDPASASGIFSISLRKVGRVRVTYLTQRGSKVVTVARIPFDIPDLARVCASDAQAGELLQRAQNRSTAIIAISGPDPVLNSTLAYALLDKLNQSGRSIIGIVENPLTYLMAHRNSIVVQCEVGTDSESLKEGVDAVLVLAPRILFVGGIRALEELSVMDCAVQDGRLILMTSSAVDAAALVERLAVQTGQPPEFLAEALKQVVRVKRTADGAVDLRIGG